MTATDACFDIKLNQEDKDIFAQATALLGTTMAGFVRTAAKEKAQELLARESRIALSPESFKAFVESLDAASLQTPRSRLRWNWFGKTFVQMAMHDLSGVPAIGRSFGLESLPDLNLTCQRYPPQPRYIRKNVVTLFV
jgi:uncharacterized protein (DUF1778 family)